MRVAYSEGILQQEYQSETELEEIIFLKVENWIADFAYSDNFSGELKIDATITDFGVDEKYAFKTIHEVDSNPFSFQKFYNSKIRGRRFALEITTNNGFTRFINPFFIAYNYIGQSALEALSRYELIFTRGRLIDNVATTIKIIEKITSITKIYAGIRSNDVTINVFSNITPSLFNYGYATTNNITTVVYQNDPTNNTLINIVDGTYYFFAVHRSTSLYDVVQATIIGGEITIILSDDNNQIITENETENFEGDFVAS